MRARTVFGCGLILLATAPAWADDDQAGADALAGSYTFASGEKEGKEIPTGRLEGNRARFSQDTITVYDKDDKELYIIRYTLDTSISPAAITMTQTGGPHGKPGTVAKGIIKVDGDTVTLCYAQEGGMYPTTFATKPGTQQHLFVLKRARKGAAK